MGGEMTVVGGSSSAGMGPPPEVERDPSASSQAPIGLDKVETVPAAGPRSRVAGIFHFFRWIWGGARKLWAALPGCSRCMSRERKKKVLSEPTNVSSERPAPLLEQETVSPQPRETVAGQASKATGDNPESPKPEPTNLLSGSSVAPQVPTFETAPGPLACILENLHYDGNPPGGEQMQQTLERACTQVLSDHTGEALANEVEQIPLERPAGDRGLTVVRAAESFKHVREPKLSRLMALHGAFVAAKAFAAQRDGAEESLFRKLSVIEEGLLFRIYVLADGHHADECLAHYESASSAVQAAMNRGFESQLYSKFRNRSARLRADYVGMRAGPTTELAGQRMADTISARIKDILKLGFAQHVLRLRQKSASETSGEMPEVYAPCEVDLETEFQRFLVRRMAAIMKTVALGGKKINTFVHAADFVHANSLADLIEHSRYLGEFIEAMKIKLGGPKIDPPLDSFEQAYLLGLGQLSPDEQTQWLDEAAGKAAGADLEQLRGYDAVLATLLSSSEPRLHPLLEPLRQQAQELRRKISVVVGSLSESP